MGITKIFCYMIVSFVDLFINPYNTGISKSKDTMEDELNYLRSEIAKIRTEKEKASKIFSGKAFNLRKFCVLCKREGNKKSKYLKDIETKNSACVAKITKVKRTTSTISKKNNKDNIERNKRNRNRKKKSDNTFSGILELFESDKESILLYHLSMLESKSR